MPTIFAFHLRPSAFKPQMWHYEACGSPFSAVRFYRTSAVFFPSAGDQYSTLFTIGGSACR